MFRKLLLYFALLLWFVVPVQAQLTIMLPEMEVESGEVVDVEMKVREFNAIIGAQWSIEWNPDILEYIKIKEVNLTDFNDTSSLNVNLNKVMEGAIGIRWDDPSLQGNTLADSAVIMVLQMRVVGNPLDEDSIKFVNSPIPIEFGDYTVGPYDTITTIHGFVTVKDVQTNTRILESGNLRLFPNQPNPFTSFTQLNFELIDAGDVHLTIYDLQGRRIWHREEYFPVGQHRVQLNGADLPSAGTYWFELNTGKHQLKQQLIHFK